MTEVAYLEIGEDLRLAYRHRTGRGPTLIFLPGYMSDMEGSKATALDQWAERERRAILRFDYSGCGISDGEFEVLERAHDVPHLAIHASRKRRLCKPRPDRSRHVCRSSARLDLAHGAVRKRNSEHLGH